MSARPTVVRGLAGEVAGVLRRHWLAALIPAALLGAGEELVKAHPRSVKSLR